MGDTKSFGCFAYAFFSIVMLASTITIGVLVSNQTINIGWIYTIEIPIILWFSISAIISKKQRANLPIIESKAVLYEKTQNNSRSGSTYYLTFTLEDNSQKTFKVELNVYAKISKNEKGLLKYKHFDKKRENLFSYIFVGFEKE